MRTRFRPLWTVTVVHGYLGGAGDLLRFIVPPSTRQRLASLHLLLRERAGVLHVLMEVDESNQPLAGAAALVGARLVLGLQPNDTAFSAFTQPTGLPAGQIPHYRNAASPHSLDAPQPVQLSGERLRLEPVQALRPLEVRVNAPDGALRFAATLGEGEEGVTPLQHWPVGAWQIEEVGGLPTRRDLEVENTLAALAPWGLLSLTVHADHLLQPRHFTITLAAPADTLRYYVVAQRYSNGDFNQLSVQDSAFAAQGRPRITFQRLATGAFGPQHLAPALLDPTGSARIVLFEARSALPRRQRGATGFELRRSGDVLIDHLPTPGATAVDAQFVLHLARP
jgi:hypothetical protein